MLSMPRSRRSFAIAIIALLVIVGTAAPGYDAVAQRMDEGSLLLYPERILKGWLPYQDFETFYGPANAYLLAGYLSEEMTDVAPSRSQVSSISDAGREPGNR